MSVSVIGDTVFQHKTPEDTIKSLRSEPSINGLLHLQASLMFSVSWYNAFLSENGLALLFELLSKDKDKLG